MNKIEQLIEKWKLKQKDLHNVGCPIDGYYMYVAEIIKDLQSLQEPTEERPTVATVLAYEQGYKEALSEVDSILKKEKCVGIPYRNGIERGIEVAEELLANSV